MRVVDTSAWIEGLVKGGQTSPVSREMPHRNRWVVPTIVQLELAKWLQREATEDFADGIIAFSRQCIVVDLDTDIALRAARVAREHKLSTADAIIYATALDQGADLLTCDAHFAGLPGVVYLSKSPN